MTQVKTPAVMELIGVQKSYAGNPPVEALRGIDLTINEGELIGLVGTSGSGKSTMLNIMGALDHPTEGNVRIQGQDLSALSDRQLSSLRGRRIGFIFQQFHLIAGLSLVENVATGLLYQGASRSQRIKNGIRLLTKVGLGNRLDHLPHQLSGGEQQRVAVARALMGEPAIILADEPTGNLDSKTSEGIVKLLHQLNEDGSTIIVVTHDRELASSFPGMVTLRDGLVESDSRTQ
ncbi:MAG TPA: ABC transporter ATP-binding protein [Acidimicrobiaceae bacterium]|jgi:putative ABC transport system ATP-binding protein|nr:ABC transporter ATP-binding protein [Actinomycetota bacterium]HAN08845.1 ABC transporter ATP-binding protein [Acidimicrobiaceae bacterium]